MNPATAEFIAQQTNPNTQDAYKHDLRTWFEFLGDREPTRGVAIDYRKFLEERYSPRTAARRYNTRAMGPRGCGGCAAPEVSSGGRIPHEAG